MAKFTGPFTVGHHDTPADDGMQRVDQQDGFISSIIFGIMLMASVVTVLIFQWIAVSVDGTNASAMLNIFIAAAIVTMLVLLRFKDTLSDTPSPPLPNISRDMADDQRVTHAVIAWFHNKIRTVLPVIGIVTFYALSSFMQLVEGVAYIPCMDTFYRCSHELFLRYTLVCLEHILKFIFMCVALVFCVRFYNRIFLRCPRVHYALVIIVVACLAVWFDTVVDECMRLVRQQYYYQCPAISNVTNLECLTLNTSFFRTTARWSKYTEPLQIEFLLLVIEMVLHLLSATRPLLRISAINNTTTTGSGTDGSGQRQPESTQPIFISAQTQTTDVAVTSTLQDTGEAQTPATNVVRYEDSFESHPSLRRRLLVNNGNVSINQTVTRVPSSPGFEPRTDEAESSLGMVILSLVSSILFLTAGMLTYIKYWQTVWIYVYEAANILYFLMSCVVCVIGFWASGKFQSKFHEFHGLEIMVLISVFGFAMYSVASLISTVECMAEIKLPHDSYRVSKRPSVKGTALPWFVFGDFFSDTVLVYLQAAFMVHASRVRCTAPCESNGRTYAPVHEDSTYNHGCDVEVPINPSGREEASPLLGAAPTRSADELRRQRTEDYRRKTLFLNCVAHLIICNFFLWVCDSFIQMKSMNVDVVQDHYYSEIMWDLVKHITLPFTLFFRFNSCIIFTEVYLDN